jgi:hypothetical protein
MKYIEELKPGDLFCYSNEKFILTDIYKARKNDKVNHSAISLLNGAQRWFAADMVVENIDLYYRDKDGNILLLKEFVDEDNIFKNKNIS